MKHLNTFLLAMTLLLCSCGKSKHPHDHDAMSGDSANTALNSLIMSKHDEVMPKMGDIYNLKKKLQDSIVHNAKLPVEKKTEFEGLISSLDSANNSMMDWMHNYDPNKDSTDQEKNRAYLESEIERINKIAERTSEVIEKAKGVLGVK